MARSFLAILRGADGRSLTRVLALLLLVSGISDAFHFGSTASAAWGPTLVLCTNDGVASGNPAAPSTPGPEDHGSCCLVGCPSAHSSVIAASADDALALALSSDGLGKPVSALSIGPATGPASIRARGPPPLA